MKLKYNFVINKVAGQFVAVPTGAMGDFNGMIKLNETGAFIFGLLNDETTVDAIIEKATAEYDCTVEEARPNVEGIINQCREAGLLAE